MKFIKNLLLISIKQQRLGTRFKTRETFSHKRDEIHRIRIDYVIILLVTAD